MISGTRSDQRMALAPGSSALPVEAAPDASWHGLYRAGGIAAIGYLIFSLIVPFGQVLWYTYDFHMGAPAFLTFIAENTVGWLTLQTLVLCSSVLAIIAFMALFVALKHLDKSYAAIGAVLAITVHILFIAYYPVLLGLVYLSDQYAAAVPAEQATYVTAAQALIAMNNGFNPFYELCFAVAVGILSWVMLKGVFSKFVAYVGLLNPVACGIALLLWPIINIGYFWWWIFFMVWFVGVGWKLIQLGRA